MASIVDGGIRHPWALGSRLDKQDPGLRLSLVRGARRQSGVRHWHEGGAGGIWQAFCGRARREFFSRFRKAIYTSAIIRVLVLGRLTGLTLRGSAICVLEIENAVHGPDQ